MIRIMTCNIWGDYFGNAVTPRAAAYVDLIERTSPDIVGIQECTAAWYDSSLFEYLKNDYTVIGSKAEKNYTPLAVRNTLEIVESGHEPYHDTPDETKGFTWALVREKSSGGAFVACNTHFWWVTGEEHDAIRCKNAAQMMDAIAAVCDRNDVGAFAFGDLNTRIGSSAFETLERAGAHHASTLAAKVDNVSSYHGDPTAVGDGTYRGTPTSDELPMSLDHIVAYDLRGRIAAYRVECSQALLDASDHSPVYIDVDIG